jgi:hypothetical protein
MNLDGLRTCARGFAGPEGPEEVFGVAEMAGMDGFEVLGFGWKEWNANG